MVTLMLKVRLFPLPMAVPPQLPSYHFQDAPLPKVPPFMVSVVEVPKQPLSRVAVMLVAFMLVSLVLMIFETHVVVLHVPSARR